MYSPFRQLFGAVSGMLVSLAIYYVLLLIAVLTVAADFRGSIAHLNDALTLGVPDRSTYLFVVAAIVLPASAVAGYTAVLLGGGPAVPLGASSSLLFVSLYSRVMLRDGSWNLAPSGIVLSIASVASAALGGFLRHRQLKRRGASSPLW